MPTSKPKYVAGSVRGFAQLQNSGLTTAEQSTAIETDLRSRYAKYGVEEIMPTHPFDLEHDQLIPGRAAMMAGFDSIDRHQATVQSIANGTITLSDGHRFDADFLLWGTGYSVDLSYFDAERSRASRPLTRLRRAVVVSSAAWMPLISTSLASA